MKIAKKEAILESGKIVGVRFTFEDLAGTVREMRFEDLSDGMRDAALAHGLLQKLGDSYSGAKGNANTALGMFQPVWDSILAGDWNLKGTGTGGIGMANLVTALAEAAGKTEEEARERIGKMEKEEIAALRKVDQIKVIIKRLELEQAEAKVDGSSEDLADLF